ncbi:MAG: type IV pili methyl-accepting chemotaxis transducer N-terminal domain-containing protein [Burkholderiales bacterium]|nr:type IV pili methyl-accepting chemotaxis transducer N-terminal domain-containing protein [Burkholderiales bacterium]
MTSTAHAAHAADLAMPPGSPASGGLGPATRPLSLGLGPGLGKYREILIAVAFFLLFDLAVLVLNFYVSFQIAEDAVAINLAGRQRMLSQRMSKALYASELAVAQGPVPAALVEELQLASRLFDSTLQGFRTGGQVSGGDGRALRLPAATGPRSADILARAIALWEPWRRLMAPLAEASALAQPVIVRSAADYARANNLALLGLMNELTTDLETAAAQRASVLRLVQTGGIVLALLNFLFILFKFVRRLRQSDAAVEQASAETRKILSVVREGLFLLTPGMTLGTQISHSVAGMFGRKVRPGDHFVELLAPLVSAKTLEDARSYVELLFTPHVKEDLVQSINPLTEVELLQPDALGSKRRRFLAMQFSRVLEGREVRHLLVTVQDVTQRVELEHRLEGEQRRAQREFDLLMQAYEADPAALQAFVQRAEASLLEVNDLLRQVDAGTDPALLRRTVERIHRLVHAVKGEASMLALDLLAGTAHAFETQLQGLRDAPAAGGDALLALPLPLEDLLLRLQTLKRSVLRTRAPAPQDGAPAEAERLARQLGHLVGRIAADTTRPATLSTRLAALAELPERTREALAQIAVQLVRNAAVHGVEDAATRAACGKPAQAHIAVELVRDEADQPCLLVRDDGAGIDPARVRQRLLALGWATEAQLAEMSPQQIVAQVFKPGFSTAEQADVHAGRGVGLDIVVNEVRRLGARLLVSSRPRQGTTFRVRFTA